MLKTANVALKPNPAVLEPKEAAERWEEAKLIYPIFWALADKFELSMIACPELETGGELPSPEVFNRAMRWIDDIDQRLHARHLRHLLQASRTITEESLRALSLRLLRKKERTPGDRDKVDYLLVQYFVLCAPDELLHDDFGLTEVARVLRPVLGEADATPPDWCQPLEEAAEALDRCACLGHLLECGVIEQGRGLKESAGNMFYDAPALLAFVRFNFLLRRALIRLLNADLCAIGEAVDGLQGRGVRSVDCRPVSLSALEPIGGLLSQCQEWKNPFRRDSSEYSTDRAFERIAMVRTILEEKLAKTPATSGLSAKSKLSGALARAAAGIPVNGRPAAPTAQPASQVRTAQTAPAGFSSSGSGASERKTLLPSTPAAPPRAALGSSASGIMAKKTVPPTAPAPGAAPRAGLSSSASGVMARKTLVPGTLAAAKPAPPTASEENPILAALGGRPAAISTEEWESCGEAIWEQLIAVPPVRGRSMTTVTVQETRVLLSSWEVAAFVSNSGRLSDAIRNAVVARALLTVAQETRKGAEDPAALRAALGRAQVEVGRLQEHAEAAKAAKNTEAAVNLGITAKRLMTLIEKVESPRL